MKNPNTTIEIQIWEIIAPNLLSLPFIKIDMSKVSPAVPALLFKLYLTEANELLAITPDILLEDLMFDI